MPMGSEPRSPWRGSMPGRDSSRLRRSRCSAIFGAGEDPGSRTAEEEEEAAGEGALRSPARIRAEPAARIRKARPKRSGRRWLSKLRRRRSKRVAEAGSSSRASACPSSGIDAASGVGGAEVLSVSAARLWVARRAAAMKLARRWPRSASGIERRPAPPVPLSGAGGWIVGVSRLALSTAGASTAGAAASSIWDRVAAWSRRTAASRRSAGGSGSGATFAAAGERGLARQARRQGPPGPRARRAGCPASCGPIGCEGPSAPRSRA